MLLARNMSGMRRSQQPVSYCPTVRATMFGGWLTGSETRKQRRLRR
jgi:hypothetical protein